MQFTQRLRARVQRGEITCSVRIWLSPRVKAGQRYRISGGEIEVDSIEQIELADITPQLARESGFASVVDLLKIAKHGRGSNVYLVRFHFIPGKAPASGKRAAPATSGKKKHSSARQRARVVRMVERLPEAAAVARNTHLSLEVRKKRFGYFLDDHHGDGRIAICCKASADLRDVLQQTAPSLFHIPKYVGSKGWIGLWLDGDVDVDWSVVEVALREAYRLVAPKTRTRTTS